jgi:hypothetical protein
MTKKMFIKLSPDLQHRQRRDVAACPRNRQNLRGRQTGESRLQRQKSFPLLITHILALGRFVNSAFLRVTI